MFITHLHKFLTASTEKNSRSTLIFWFCLSMTLSVVYGILALQQAFAHQYVIQDDARQHVFWMLRFIDPALFPHDLIADYFQSVAPAGYTWLYQIAATLGMNPLVFSKILPLILGIFCTYYCFGICLEILPVPFSGFIATLVMNQGIWMKDDLASATPRGFAYPLFLAFLYYLLRGSWMGTGFSIALIGLFYPHYVFVASGILVLRLLCWKNGRLEFSANRQDYLFSGMGLSIAFMVLLPYALTSSEFGPAISRREAMQLREFLPNGRSTFFHVNPKNYWLTGKRSGMFPKSLFTPATQCAIFFLPFLLPFPSIFPLVKALKSSIWILVQLFLASVGMFFVAHAVLFKLHLPSRYTGLSFRIIVALGTAIALTIIIDALFHWAETFVPSKPSPPAAATFNPKPILAMGLSGLILTTLVVYPAFVKGFPLVRYKQGNVPTLYEYFQKQPKDSLIASLDEEVNQLPTFAQRSILVGREYAIPYQIGYYRQFRQRTFDLIRAQYSLNLADVQQLIQKYGIDFWILHRGAFTQHYLENDGWLMQFEATQEAMKSLEKNHLPALAKVMQKCPVFLNEDLVVLDAHCLAKLEAKN